MKLKTLRNAGFASQSNLDIFLLQFVSLFWIKEFTEDILFRQWNSLTVISSPTWNSAKQATSLQTILHKRWRALVETGFSSCEGITSSFPTKSTKKPLNRQLISLFLSIMCVRYVKLSKWFLLNDTFEQHLSDCLRFEKYGYFLWISSLTILPLEQRC